MKISSVYWRTITRQEIIGGNLITEFRADLDLLIGHPAGILICKPFTDSDRAEYRAKYPDSYDCSEAILSATVTRFGVLFWDSGELVPVVVPATDR